MSNELVKFGEAVRDEGGKSGAIGRAITASTPVPGGHVGWVQVGAGPLTAHTPAEIAEMQREQTAYAHRLWAQSADQGSRLARFVVRWLKAKRERVHQERLAALGQKEVIPGEWLPLTGRRICECGGAAVCEDCGFPR